ncbi:hypothetical protein JYU14_04075 [Simkania negevensis]|uniref:Uncharacterized protein n=1 Tax=Simkania negevensis TaxID=83561 RepID=A0ABS3ASX6_9BACT|nr:hypothetical protein [Simkania negevensis]
MRRYSFFCAVAALVVVVVLWAVFSQFLHRDKEEFTLSFPEEEDLIVHIDTDVYYFEAKALERDVETHLHLVANLRGSPSPLLQGMRYRCSFDLFELYDSQNLLLLGFYRGSNRHYEYRSDSRADGGKKRFVWELLQVDWSSNNALDDFSFFQQPIEIILSTRGQLLEVLLYPETKKSLFSLTKNYRGLDRLIELVTYPQKIPPLFAARPTAQKWKTTGEGRMASMRFVHRVATKKGNSVVVNTEGKVEQLTAAASAERQPIDLWKIEYRYDRSRQFIQDTKFEITLGSRREIFNNTLNTSLILEGNAAFSFEPSPFLIEDVF